jgi:hypothetical protein
LLLAGVLDELELRSYTSKTPAGSNLGEQSSASDDGRKHRPKYVKPNWNSNFDVLPTVHLSITLDNDQPNAQIF